MIPESCQDGVIYVLIYVLVKPLGVGRLLDGHGACERRVTRQPFVDGVVEQHQGEAVPGIEVGLLAGDDAQLQRRVNA
jgi:hypothetical protein